MTIESIVKEARRNSRTVLNELESKQVMKEAGISVVEAGLAKSKDEAVVLSLQYGFPVVIKILSNEITHKSDVGGVKLDLWTPEQVGKAYDELMSTVTKLRPNASITGVSVQKMAPPGVEVIIGMTKDAQFGPVLMFGLGGIMVEILKDVSFAIVPLEKDEAREMIREITCYHLLEGYRGTKPVDVEYLEGMLLSLSGFVQEHPEIREIDLNPIFAYEHGAIAVDARVILEIYAEPVAGEKIP